MASMYYVVMVEQMATADNVNFKDETRLYVYGKGDRQFLEVRNGNVIWDMITPGVLSLYGYKSIGAAKHNWSYRNPECSKSWMSYPYILEIEVNDNKIVYSKVLDENPI